MPAPMPPGRIGWAVVLVALILAAGVAALVLPVNRAASAGALVGVILVLVLVVMLPARRAAQEGRRIVSDAARALDDSVDLLIARMAAVGYTVPSEVALDWVSSPEPSATVPLVHDSVIAARWWRPAEGDDRVFVEPYLLQEGRASTLPVARPRD